MHHCLVATELVPVNRWIGPRKACVTRRGCPKLRSCARDKCTFVVLNHVLVGTSFPPWRLSPFPLAFARPSFLFCVSFCVVSLLVYFLVLSQVYLWVFLLRVFLLSLFFMAVAAESPVSESPVSRHAGGNWVGLGAYHRKDRFFLGCLRAQFSPSVAPVAGPRQQPCLVTSRFTGSTLLSTLWPVQTMGFTNCPLMLI